MKRQWEAPCAIAQKFVPNDYISTCKVYCFGSLSDYTFCNYDGTPYLGNNFVECEDIKPTDIHLPQFKDIEDAYFIKDKVRATHNLTNDVLEGYIVVLNYLGESGPYAPEEYVDDYHFIPLETVTSRS